MCCCVEGACEEVDWGWDVELVSEEEQEVVLTFELVAWMVSSGRDTFQSYNFYDLYDFITISF